MLQPNVLLARAAADYAEQLLTVVSHIPAVLSAIMTAIYGAAG